MSRSQNVGRTASRTQTEACDATAASPPMVTLMLHVACMYTATAVVVKVARLWGEHPSVNDR